MTANPKELTINEVARQLHVEMKWIVKAIVRLGLGGSGQGRRRFFSDDEFRIIENIKLLRLSGVSWQEMADIRFRERKVLSEIRKCTTECLKEKMTEASKMARPTAWQIDFILTEPYRPFIEHKDAKNLDILRGAAKLWILRESKAILASHELKKIKGIIQDRIQSRIQSLEDEKMDLQKAATILTPLYSRFSHSRKA